MANETQVEEVETLKSIYFPEELQVRESKIPGQLQILAWAPVAVPDNYQVKYIASLADEEPSYLKIKHLPPIQARFNLPQTYPELKPPRVVFRCEWLSNNQFLRLTRALNRLWRQNKGSPIIYTWVEFMKSDALAVLKLERELDITALSKEHLQFVAERQNISGKKEVCGDSGSKKTVNDRAKGRKKAVKKLLKNSLVQIIDSYDKEQRKAEFLKEFHLCEICFNDKPGNACMMFERCGHTYCRECLTEYFTVLINEGNAKSVRCPAFKCTTEATQSQLRELVPQETFEKYDNALLSAMLDTMTDIVYCPRRICQYPATREPDERFAQCPRCHYAFCIYCKMVYHGVEPCRFTVEERRRLVEEYEKGSTEEKAEMEKRYGKTQLTNLLHNTLNEGWIKENSKNCPQCNSSIEKSEGCNKMTCWRCQTYFCWLCGTQLNPAAPYIHFRDPKSPCNEKLFHLAIDEEDGWGDWEIFEEEDSGESDLEGEDTDSDV